MKWPCCLVAGSWQVEGDAGSSTRSSAEAQQCAMALLGNLMTDEFDHEARQSLQMFVAGGGLSSLQSKLSAEQPICLFACATLQNLTSLDPIGCCNVLREQA